jgi:hypothetical protein
MEEVDEEQQDLLSEEQEEAKPNVYLVIFAKIIFLK